MAAEDFEYEAAFDNLIGTSGEQEVYSGHYAESYTEWAVLFESIGIDGLDTSAATIDAFENFLIAFYPGEGTSPSEWEALRDEFYALYDVSPDDIDWEAWREAIGYGRG